MEPMTLSWPEVLSLRGKRATDFMKSTRDFDLATDFIWMLIRNNCDREQCKMLIHSLFVH